MSGQTIGGVVEIVGDAPLAEEVLPESSIATEAMLAKVLQLRLERSGLAADEAAARVLRAHSCQGRGWYAAIESMVARLLVDEHMASGVSERQALARVRADYRSAPFEPPDE